MQCSVVLRFETRVPADDKADQFALRVQLKHLGRSGRTHVKVLLKHIDHVRTLLLDQTLAHLAHVVLLCAAGKKERERERKREREADAERKRRQVLAELRVRVRRYSKRKKRREAKHRDWTAKNRKKIFKKAISHSPQTDLIRGNHAKRGLLVDRPRFVRERIGHLLLAPPLGVQILLPRNQLVAALHVLLPLMRVRVCVWVQMERK
jgi:hypothetical protein